MTRKTTTAADAGQASKPAAPDGARRSEPAAKPDGRRGRDRDTDYDYEDDRYRGGEPAPGAGGRDPASPNK